MTKGLKSKLFEKWTDSELGEWVNFVIDSNDPNETRSLSRYGWQSSYLTPRGEHGTIQPMTLIKKLVDFGLSQGETSEIVSKVYIGFPRSNAEALMKMEHLYESVLGSEDVESVEESKILSSVQSTVTDLYDLNAPQRIKTQAITWMRRMFELGWRAHESGADKDFLETALWNLSL
jgi:hypothetical protein